MLDGAKVSFAAGSGLLLRTGSILVSGGGTLDLGTGDMMVQSTPADRAAAVAALLGLIRSARDGVGGRWRGPGITSSAARTTPSTTLAAMPNPGLTSFGGEPVDGNSILVKYTYDGDANLDGRINADDFFRIDCAFLEQPANPTFAQGNFNYDGRINADDYFLIDSAFLGQGVPLASSASLRSQPTQRSLAASPTIRVRRTSFTPFAVQRIVLGTGIDSEAPDTLTLKRTRLRHRFRG